MKYIMSIIILLLVFVSYSYAGCRWEWVCDSKGNCKQEAVCDSSLDIAPPRPPSVSPIVPPTVKPLDPLTIPPIGTSKCERVRLCDSLSNCRWDVVCY